MARIVLIYIIVFCSINSFGQKIETEIDPFTKERRVRTDYVMLVSTMSKSLFFSFRSHGDAVFLVASGDGSHVIGSTDRMQVLLSDDSIVNLTHTGAQSYKVSIYAQWHHQYHISEVDLERMTKNSIVSVRKYISDIYTDYTSIKPKNAAKVRDLAIKFTTTYNAE